MYAALDNRIAGQYWCYSRCRFYSSPQDNTTVEFFRVSFEWIYSKTCCVKLRNFDCIACNAVEKFIGEQCWNSLMAFDYRIVAPRRIAPLYPHLQWGKSWALITLWVTSKLRKVNWWITAIEFVNSPSRRVFGYWQEYLIISGLLRWWVHIKWECCYFWAEYERMGRKEDKKACRINLFLS